MRVFISSVRKGLEEERDALDGLIRAAGHTPVRFEDFSAQTIPSREACLRGVAAADVYLLLLGPSYGHRFDDTGKSPTHEEWVVATTSGMPRLVYRKNGVEFEEDQHDLAQQISEYTSGVFRDSFDNTLQLLTKVTAKLREMELSDGQLDYQSLDDPIELEWADSFLDRSSSTSSLLEVHVTPYPGRTLSARRLVNLGESLRDRVRATGFVNSGLAIDVNTTESAAAVQISPGAQGSWDQPRESEILSVRLGASGQVSVLASLPKDGIGHILDPALLPTQIATALRLIGAINIVESDRVVIGVGLTSISMLGVRRFDVHYGQRSGSISVKTSDGPLRVEPDESISREALGSGAIEVAESLASILLQRYELRR